MIAVFRSKLRVVNRLSHPFQHSLQADVTENPPNVSIATHQIFLVWVGAILLQTGALRPTNGIWVRLEADGCRSESGISNASYKSDIKINNCHSR